MAKIIEDSKGIFYPESEILFWERIIRDLGTLKKLSVKNLG
jgi:hypothetical protein